MYYYFGKKEKVKTGKLNLVSKSVYKKKFFEPQRKMINPALKIKI